MSRCIHGIRLSGDGIARCQLNTDHDGYHLVDVVGIDLEWCSGEPCDVAVAQ